MVKKGKSLLGVLVVILAFGMMVVGCDDDEYVWYFHNQSSHVVHIRSSTLDPSEFSIERGQVRSAKSHGEYLNYEYNPGNLVAPTRAEGTNRITFTDR